MDLLFSSYVLVRRRMGYTQSALGKVCCLIRITQLRTLEGAAAPGAFEKDNAPETRQGCVTTHPTLGRGHL